MCLCRSNIIKRLFVLYRTDRNQCIPATTNSLMIMFDYTVSQAPVAFDCTFYYLCSFHLMLILIFVDFVQMGLIAISAVDQQPKIKIYRDAENNCKGDCALCYNAESSLAMALEVLHEGYIRPGFKILVKKAEFQARDDAQGSEGGGGMEDKSSTTGETQSHNQFKQSRPKLSQAQVKVAKSAMRQALTWNEDDDMGVSKSKALKIVVIEGKRSLYT